MRLVKELALSPGIKCSLFLWNEKYIIKMESGNLEQTIKVPVYEISSEEDLETKLHEAGWIHRLEQVFSQMKELESQLLDY